MGKGWRDGGGEEEQLNDAGVAEGAMDWVTGRREL